MQMFDLTLTDSQQAIVQVAPVNFAGNPAPQTGVPTFSVSNPGVVVLTPSADGTTVTVAAAAVGTTGTTTVLVNGVSASGKPFSGSFTVGVVSGTLVNEAVTFEFTFGPPTPIPPATAPTFRR